MITFDESAQVIGHGHKVINRHKMNKRKRSSGAVAKLTLPPLAPPYEGGEQHAGAAVKT